MTPGTHTCPGLCGRELVCALFACRACERRLPAALRDRIMATWWACDWPAHSRAMTDALHHYADHVARQTRSGGHAR